MSSQIRSLNKSSMRTLVPSKINIKKVSIAPKRQRTQTITKAGYIGSPTNVIMVVSTALCLAAGRFGLAPTANKLASAGLNLSNKDSGMKTGDPSGFTAVDVLALGSFGHMLGVIIIVVLKNTGGI